VIAGGRPEWKGSLTPADVKFQSQKSANLLTIAEIAKALGDEQAFNCGDAKSGSVVHEVVSFHLQPSVPITPIDDLDI
jgi:hypothetical protein